MGWTQRICLVVLLAAGLCCCSGCATILGGIIGHQSGELCAGLAIGAAVDFGGCVVDGVGQLLTDPEQEFKEKAVLDSETGEITLPEHAFSVNRTKELLKSLERKLADNGWDRQTTMMKSSRGATCQLQERWTCKKEDAQTFELTIHLQTNQNPEFRIDVPPESTLDRGAMTIRVYTWLKEIVT